MLLFIISYGNVDSMVANIMCEAGKSSRAQPMHHLLVYIIEYGKMKQIHFGMDKVTSINEKTQWRVGRRQLENDVY